ncbi:MAG: aminotransferase class V-fold PLP-dependent enzyme [Chlamydiia bacterium]|nr:aminotransferase class V-fold PLP-dependent enzyme [Chlamydiia bacterium]
MEPIYLDNGTLKRPSDHLLNQMVPFLKRHWPSITAPYLKGKEPFTSIERSLCDLRAFVGAGDLDAFHFCSSGSQAAAEVFQSFAFDHVTQTGKNHFLTSKIESAPILLQKERLEKIGIYAQDIPLNEQGQVTPEALREAITPKTGLIALSWANPLTGVIHPIWDLAECAKEHDILFYVDASAALGSLYFKFEELPLDFLSFDGPLLHGPKGSGGLFVRRGVDFSPSAPVGMEGADLNLAALVGLGIAVEEMSASFDHLSLETARLTDKLEQGIALALPEIKILFKEAERLPTTTAIVFPGASAELLAFHLREQGVHASFGGGNEQKLEPLLTSSGIDPFDAKCALSFSLSRMTTEEEIDRAIAVIVDCAQRCQTFSRELAL